MYNVRRYHHKNAALHTSNPMWLQNSLLKLYELFPDYRNFLIVYFYKYIQRKKYRDLLNNLYNILFKKF